MSVSVCFVCLGNICRLPTAEAVLVRLVQEAGLADVIAVDSAGTAAYHAGEPADRRSRAAAAARGYAVTSVARQFVRGDFARFDYVVAMDRSNYAGLRELANGDEVERLSMMRAWEAEPAEAVPNVPDPYYGGEDGFEAVLDICARACAGLLEHLRHEHQL